MSTLDNIVASVQDSILPGLNYNLSSRKGASFVHARTLSTFYPTTSGVYSPNSQRTVKVMFSDSGNGFLDLSTIRVQMRIRNTSGSPLIVGGRHTACLFQRLQSRIKGQSCDDILDYGRLAAMLQHFQHTRPQCQPGGAHGRD